MDDKIFKKFSEASRRVLISAQKIAQSMGEGIGSQHFLLSLAITPGTFSYEILQEHSITPDQIRLVLSLGEYQTDAVSGLSDEAKKILKSAVTIAADYRHFNIEGEHLLLAILQDKTSLAHQIIVRIGADPSIIRSQIERVYSELADLDNIIQNRPMIEPGILSTPRVSPFGKPQTRVQTPAIDYFTIDLTKQVREGKIDPVIGRDKEISRVIQILCRRIKNNPVLVGEPGVGKTAIVEGLARRIIDRQIPALLINKRVVILDLALLVAGTMYRGQFEDRLKKLINEIVRDKNVILFIDEFHTVVGAGSAEGSMDLANIIKPALAKGLLRLIGATTYEEYRKHIEKDTALERRLQKVLVEEPTVEETIEILKGIQSKYEEHHRVKIEPEAIVAAAKLSKRYISDRFLPDKAIDLIDEAGAATQLGLKAYEKNNKIAIVEQELKNIREKKNQMIKNQSFEQAAVLRDREKKLRIQLEALQTPQEKQWYLSQRTINPENIAQAVSDWTHIPLNSLVKDESHRFLNLEKNLSKYIIGQPEAIKAVAQAVKRSKSRISDPNRPIGSFVFLGPTGVGKTELARVLAKEVFGREEALVKIDMSEFMERHNVSRLVGAPPGYIGYEEAGKLTETIRRQPYSLVLLDEIEKAHPEVFNILLQIMEDGYLTDAKGRRVNFKNTIIIMTSNIGLTELNQQAIGFSTGKISSADYDSIKNQVLSDLKDHFRPEFLNRIDKVIVFRPLDKGVIREIVDLQIKMLIERLAQEEITISVDEKAKDLIASVGFDPTLGARPIRRAIADLIEDPLSDAILSRSDQDKIIITAKANRIVLGKKKAPRNFSRGTSSRVVH